MRVSRLVPSYCWLRQVRSSPVLRMLSLTVRLSGKVSTRPIRWGESNDPGVREARIMFAMPRFVKRLYAWYLRHIKRDDAYAGLIENWSEKTVEEYLRLIAKREGYREQWFHKLRDGAFDFILTVPNALPATPHGGIKTGFKACGYTFLWNIVRGFHSASECPCIVLELIGWCHSSTTVQELCQSRTSTKSSTGSRSSAPEIPSSETCTRCTTQPRCMDYLSVYKWSASGSRRRRLWKA